jgi:acyl-CoA dehydrogenase
VLIEELAKINASGPGFSLQSDIVAPYILHYGSDEQKRTWLPRLASGETISAIAMTEPGTGSDLASITTRAEPDGDGFAITGAKTFVTNGVLSDLIIVVAKTDPSAGARGVSLFLVERRTPGFHSAPALKKLGMHAQDTAEFTLDRVHVPASSMLGAPGMGFKMLMSELPQERMIIAVSSVASAKAGLDATIAYTRDREAFGKRLLDFQNTRFTLASLKAQIAMAQTFVDRCIELLVEGRLDAATAAMAKMECSELEFRTPATATCASTRSPKPGPTPASNASTAAPTKSCEKSSAARWKANDPRPRRPCFDKLSMTKTRHPKLVEGRRGGGRCALLAGVVRL